MWRSRRKHQRVVTNEAIGDAAADRLFETKHVPHIEHRTQCLAYGYRDRPNGALRRRFHVLFYIFSGQGLAWRSVGEPVNRKFRSPSWRWIKGDRASGNFEGRALALRGPSILRPSSAWVAAS